MKKFLIIVVICLVSFLSKAQETFHDFTQVTIIHDSLHLSDYAGKKVLVVNTASFCAYTPELGDLRILDSIYGGPNFAIICFPCNDFGGQEPYDDSTIYQFYLGNYHVGFQLMSKIAITSADTAEVYKWLQLQSRNGVANANVTWNFNKFCIDEAGHWIRRFSQTVSPLDTAITNWIQSPNTTGIAAKNNSTEIILHGNPAYGKIDLEVKTSKEENLVVELFDLQGKQVGQLFSGKIIENKSFSFTPQNLDKGIYFLKVHSTTMNKVMKVCYIN
ncbi:hypothetical protein BH11BAC1_BH11BAC1_11610 [soil metagenome]